jgi:mannosyltransferase
MKKSFSSTISHLHPNWIFFGGILPLAAVLTFLYLGDKSFWFDEIFSVNVAGMNWPEFRHVLFRYEANQGLYHFLLHLWLNLGQSEFAVRSLSALLALATLVTIYFFANHLFRSRTGIIAALLITINAVFIAYAQEARAYMLALFLSTLSSYYFVKSMEKPGWIRWSVYVLISALGVYAHIYVVLILISHFASLILFPRRDIPWKHLSFSVIALAFLLMPITYLLLTCDIGQIGWITRPGLREVIELFYHLSGRGGTILLLAYFIAAAACLFLIVTLYVQRKLTIQAWHYIFLLSWLCLPIIVSFSYSFVKPIFYDRYFIIVLTPLVILVGEGLCHLKQKWLAAGVAAVLALVPFFTLRDWYTGESNQKEDWRGAVGYIVSSAQPDDAIVFYHPAFRLCYDFYRGRMNATHGYPTPVYYLSSVQGSLNPYYLPERFSFGKEMPDLDPSLINRLGGYKRVWLVLGYIDESAKKAQPEMMEDFFREKYDVRAQKSYCNDIRISLYTLRAHPKTSF